MNHCSDLRMFFKLWFQVLNQNFILFYFSLIFLVQYCQWWQLKRKETAENETATNTETFKSRNSSPFWWEVSPTSVSWAFGADTQLCKHNECHSWGWPHGSTVGLNSHRTHINGNQFLKIRLICYVTLWFKSTFIFSDCFNCFSMLFNFFWQHFISSSFSSASCFNIEMEFSDAENVKKSRLSSDLL